MNLHRSILLVLISAVLASADTLRWDYETGWTAGHIMTINTTKGTITLVDRENKSVKSVKMVNSVNVLSYVNSLLAKISEEAIGDMACDGPVNKIVCFKNGVTNQKIIYGVSPPGRIACNEGYAATKELNDVERFKMVIDGFLVWKQLSDLKTHYFPDSEEGPESKANQTRKPADSNQSAINFDTDRRWQFIGDVSPVHVGGKPAVIDNVGEFVWKPGLLTAEIRDGGIYIKALDGREGYLDDSGKLIADGKPNFAYYKPMVTDADVAGGKPIPLPPDKAGQVKAVSRTLEFAAPDESVEKMVSKIKLLLASGLDVNARDASGNTALLMAASHLHRPAKVFKVLLDAGADVNAQNDEGNTALHGILHWAEQDLDAIRLLLAHGISVTTPNKSGDTAFAEIESVLDEEPEPGSEPDTRLIAAKLLVAAGADKWKDYSGRPVTVVPGPPQRIDPIVSKLTDPALRDDAFRTILSWQKYRSKPTAPERVFKPLRHVVVCPQKQGPPIYAVFPMTSYEQRAEAKGHIMLVDADGAMIPCYLNANSIQDPSEFKDVNGDGVIDEVSTISFGSSRVLHILPITREQSPSLNIVLKRIAHNETEWSWKLTETSQPDVFVIELGPFDSGKGQLIPKAQYKWSKESSEYVGPAGGGELPFMRLNGADPFDSEEYDRFVGKSGEK